jgi:hypothetical protein
MHSEDVHTCNITVRALNLYYIFIYMLGLFCVCVHARTYTMDPAVIWVLGLTEVGQYQYHYQCRDVDLAGSIVALNLAIVFSVNDTGKDTTSSTRSRTSWERVEWVQKLGWEHYQICFSQWYRYKKTWVFQSFEFNPDWTLYSTLSYQFPQSDRYGPTGLVHKAS